MTVIYKLKSKAGYDICLKEPNRSAVVDASRVPNFRCPHCMHIGAFSRLVPNDFLIAHNEINPTSKTKAEKAQTCVGVRVCPNPECKGIVFAVMDDKGASTCLPNEVLDFDASDIPLPIAKSLQEAIKCHSSECYKAAALMVRRTLEELCDERKATGGTLKDRLGALSKIVIVPQELLAAADHLRLLGNDAAHVEAKNYENVGEAEVRVAIDLTKELLKASYQFKGLLGRLTALQKAPP